MKNNGAKLVTKKGDLILEGKAEAKDQSMFFTDESELRHAPKIVKETCKIEWNNNIKDIHNLVRGMSPYPAAWTQVLEEEGEPLTFKIYETEKIDEPHNLEPGTIKTDNKPNIYIAGKDGCISLKIIQAQGKKRMDINSCLN